MVCGSRSIILIPLVNTPTGCREGCDVESTSGIHRVKDGASSSSSSSSSSPTVSEDEEDEDPEGADYETYEKSDRLPATTNQPPTPVTAKHSAPILNVNQPSGRQVDPALLTAAELHALPQNTTIKCLKASAMQVSIKIEFIDLLQSG